MHLLRLHFSVPILTMLLLWINTSESAEPMQKVSKVHEIKLNALFQFRLNKT